MQTHTYLKAGSIVSFLYYNTSVKAKKTEKKAEWFKPSARTIQNAVYNAKAG